MTTVTITVLEFSDEQVAEALRTARPVDNAEVEQAQARATAALEAAFAPTRQEQPWTR